MWHVALQGLELVVRWPAIGYMMLGILVGLYVGAVPGLGGIVAMSVLLPFTFGMDAPSAFAMLIGMYAVTCTSDTLAAVLLGVPGTAAGQATILDGYPLAQKGEAARAFGAAYTCSAVGGLLGALVLGLSIPIIRPLILSFAPPEFFMLGLLGLTMVGSLSGGSVLKGLLVALFGLLMAEVGYSVQGGIPRYYFGTPYLLDGLPLVPVVLGFFGVPEALDLAIHNKAISKTRQNITIQRQLLKQGILDAFRHWWLMIRCATVGMYIGLLPGMGGAVADWLAYGHAVQSAKDKSGFGKGDIRGVIAPEAANNATRGPALIPTATLGIPGTAGMAILLGAFLIQGLTPGPQMLTSKLDLTFSFVWTLVIANIVGAALMMLWSNQLAKVTFVRGNLIIPAIILFVFMGSWMTGQQIGNWYTLLVFGAFGYVLKHSGWPRPPFVLGFILGPIMENALSISLQAFGWRWVERPISFVILLIVIGTLIFAAVNATKRRRGRARSTVTESTPAPMTSSLSLSLGIAALLTCVFIYALGRAVVWPYDAALFPIATTIPAILLCLVVLTREGLQLRAAMVASGRGFGETMLASMGDPADLKRACWVFLWFCSIIAATYLVGQLIAIPLVVLLFLRYWGHETWRMAVGQAVIIFLTLYFMFGDALNVLWYNSLLDQLV